MEKQQSVSKEDREKYGEKVILDQIDWELNSDPYFWENRHLSPILANQQPGGREDWIYYNTTKFSGKRLVVEPGETFISEEKGVYSIFAWRGSGTVGGIPIKGESPGEDELIIIHSKATTPVEIKNTSSRVLEIFKFFGPDINPDVPMKKIRTIS